MLFRFAAPRHTTDSGAPAHRLAEIRYFCQHSQAKAYLIDGAQRPFDYQALAQELLACCPTLQTVIVRGQTRVTDPKFIELASCYSASSCQANADPNQIAFFQLSGGTTARPSSSRVPTMITPTA